jgi:hypothetical protein
MVFGSAEARLPAIGLGRVGFTALSRAPCDTRLARRTVQGCRHRQGVNRSRLSEIYRE